MNNNLVLIKVRQRLNKLSSSDYVNIEDWMIIEAFNKAQDEWYSNQLQGINQKKETAEGSIRSIDKLQVVLKEVPITLTQTDLYSYAPVPDDYVEWSRVSGFAFINSKDNCCPPRRLKIYLGEEADRDIVILDKNLQPSYEWAETFATIMSGTIRIYTNGCFDITTPSLTYYRKAAHIEIAGVVNPDTGILSTTDVECEFPGTSIEVILDETADILAGDMDNYSKQNTLSQQAEHNN